MVHAFLPSTGLNENFFGSFSDLVVQTLIWQPHDPSTILQLPTGRLLPSSLKHPGGGPPPGKSSSFGVGGDTHVVRHVPLQHVSPSPHAGQHSLSATHVPLQHFLPLGQVSGVLLVQQRSFAMQTLPHFLKPAAHSHAVPCALQVEFSGQVPQVPPQPLEPQTLPLQFGVQHVPLLQT